MQTFFQEISTKIAPWLLDHGVKILVILIVAWLVRKFIALAIEKVVRKVIVSSSFSNKGAEKKREDTLIRIFTSGLGAVIWVLAGLIILEEAGFAIGPLLAAAGIAGLALGFGGQYLIRDLISGLFIIIENQYRVGDSVSLNDIRGSVEDISLRMTTLRDMDGVVHHIPNGEIKKVSNLTKGFARVNLDVGVAYSSDIDQVASVINRVGRELAEDPNWKESVLKPPQFLRVEDLGDSAIMVKILGETTPVERLAVTGELRKRLKMAFDKEGIEIPFPQMVVHKLSS